MFYQPSNVPTFLVEQVDLIGGIDFVCLEVGVFILCKIVAANGERDDGRNVKAAGEGTLHRPGMNLVLECLLNSE